MKESDQDSQLRDSFKAEGQKFYSESPSVLDDSKGLLTTCQATVEVNEAHHGTRDKEPVTVKAEGVAKTMSMTADAFPANEVTIDALALREQAYIQLLQIRDIESGIGYLNKVKSIEVYLKAEKKDAELMRLAAEQKIRTQRIVGQLIRDGQKNGTSASKGTFTSNQHVGCRTMIQPKTLAEMGVSRMDSSRFQHLGRIPDERFESFIKASSACVKELTTASAVAYAKSLEPKKEKRIRLETPLSDNDRQEVNVILADLTRRLTQRQLKALVELLTCENIR